jgi:SOS response regulatory protein OraA/RecX
MGELAQLGAVDDAAYGAWHVAQRGASVTRARSRLELSSELHRKGLARGVAEEALGAHDEGAAAATLARRKPQHTDAEVTAYLRRKGFAFAAVQAAVRDRRKP